jgi:hypothetical protein
MTVRDLAVRSPLRGHVLHAYPYFFTPAMLSGICGAVDRVRDVPGAFLEIGCARGHTTVFLNRHLEDSGHQRRDYVCIDTFAGFVDSDVEYEVDRRGKGEHLDTFQDSFRLNSLAAFEETMRINGCEGVRAIQGDVRTVDLGALGPIAFALIDVDLYLPVRDALDDVVDQMSPGGVVIVDDCVPNVRWDGALEAYREIVAKLGREPDIRHGKLGFIEF